MRTLCLAFVTAGVIFAQAPVTLHPLLRIAPRTINATLPGVNPAPAAAPGRCAVPLIEMKAPATGDSITRTPSPQAMADLIPVQPPVQSCGAAAPVDANPYNIVPPAQAPK